MRRLALLLLFAAAPARAEAPAAATAAAEDATAAAVLRASLIEEERALLASQEEQGRVTANLRRLAEEQRDVRRSLAELAVERIKLTTRIAELEETRAALAAEAAARKERAGKRLALLSRRSTARPLELLLTSSGPGDFVYRYLALQEIVRAERELFVAARQSADRLARAQAELEADLAAARELEDDYRTAAARIDALEALEREQFAALASEAEERRLWVAALREQAERLGVLVRDLQARGGAQAAPQGLQPVAGTLVARYGETDPAAGGLLPSDGWRFRAAEGAPVAAVAAGTVRYADWFQGYGYLVIVDHGGGVSTLYAHLGAPAVAKGADVLAGETVGSAGASGSAAEPGLYFEVRKDGRPVDPGAWLKKRKKR